MFKSRELSNLQQRVATLEKQLKAANADSTKLKGELKAATAKVQRYKAALDDLSAAIKAKASEGEDEEPAAEDEPEDKPAGKKAKKAEGEEAEPSDDEEDAPAAEGEEEPMDDEDEPSAEGEEEPADDEEDNIMKKSKASLALLNRIPGKAALNKQVEKKAAKVVTSRLAAAGVDPVKRDPAAAEGNDGTKKPDASLPPRERAKAAMSGWKVFGKN